MWYVKSYGSVKSMKNDYFTLVLLFPSFLHLPSSTTEFYQIIENKYKINTSEIHICLEKSIFMEVFMSNYESKKNLQSIQKSNVG